MSRRPLITFSLTALAAATLVPMVALADVAGKPVEWQFGYQAPVTEIAERVQGYSSVLHWLMALIAIFVTILLAYTCWRFSASRNPEPKRFTHNTTIEVVWTVVPVLILVGMAYPSIKLLYFQETVPPADVTVKAIGNQWNWTYMYDVDGEEVYVDSLMAGHGYSSYEAMVAGMTDEGYGEDEIPSRELWKLQATEPMVVPENAIVRVQVTASDVLHAWTVPSFGVKVDAVPGRLNETWFKAEQTGTFYGQCSELCGVDHSYMPIMVEVVSQADYAERMSAIRDEWASRDVPNDVKVALAAPVAE